MIQRWFRRALRRCGFDLPFHQVICPEHVKTISVDPDLRAKVTVRRMLVFLDVPESGDLRDTIAVEPGAEPESVFYESPDAMQIYQERRGRDTLVSWKPREGIIPYALYMHEYSWHPSGSHGQLAMCADIRCDIRTGMFVLEMLTPATFETAVVFRRPRWRRLSTERRVIKYALRQMDGKGERPAISSDGKRLEWKAVGPKVGDRYICVVFHRYGMAQWEERLKSTSFVGRLRQLLIPA